MLVTMVFILNSAYPTKNTAIYIDVGFDSEKNYQPSIKIQGSIFDESNFIIIQLEEFHQLKKFNMILSLFNNTNNIDGFPIRYDVFYLFNPFVCMPEM